MTYPSCNYKEDPMSLFMQFKYEFRSAFRFQVLYMGISIQIIPASPSPSPFLIVLCSQDRQDAASSVAHVDNSMAVLSYPYDVRPVMGNHLNTRSSAS